MLLKKNKGGILLKLGVVLVILAAVGFAVTYRLQATAHVKAVTRSDAVDAVTGSVLVLADKGIRPLKSEASGKVVDCAALDPKKQFKKGDVLLKLDDTELVRQIAETKRKFESARQRKQIELTGGKPEKLIAARELSDDERVQVIRELNPQRKVVAQKLEDAKRLNALGDTSDEEVRSIERTLEQIDMSLQLGVFDQRHEEADFEALMRSLKLQHEKMTLRAEFDGEVEGVSTWPGAMVDVGTQVATVFSNDRQVTVKISEEDFGRLREGQTANVRLLSYGDQLFPARISKLMTVADEAQRFTVFLEVEADRALLKPGSTGEATITVDRHPDAVVIPRRALFGDNNRVYVVKNGRVERREVQVGFTSALNVVEVLKGVTAGEQIIVEQLEVFRDGQRVRVQEVP